MAWSDATRLRLPWWLLSGEGGALKYSIDRMLCALSQRAYDGLLARFPEYAPDDALPLLCRDRGVVRGINEPRDSIVARLLRFLDDKASIGGAFALHAQLRAYMQADVMVRTVDRRGNWYTTDVGGATSYVLNSATWDWDDAPANPRWARFWVIIYPTAGVPWAASEPGAWPVGGTIGTTATPDQVASVRAIIDAGKPAGTRCEWIIIAFDPASFAPSTPEPDGTWKWFGRADGTGYVPARLTTARYWKGAA